MRTFDSWQLLIALAAFGSGPPPVAAQETWATALARMPLPAVSQLNRSNCVEVMLGAFRSNAVVKALIFMPGATDEFYMFGRAKAELTNAAPTLLDAIGALTNQTRIRAAFRPPFLLLHADVDRLEPLIQIEHQPTADRLRQTPLPGAVRYNDRDWDFLQPVFKKALKIDLRPWRYSPASWHFYRHSFAAANLTGWEALEAAALSGKSAFIVRRREVIFVRDQRGAASERRVAIKGS
jgi:hypothetical protein